MQFSILSRTLIESCSHTLLSRYSQYILKVQETGLIHTEYQNLLKQILDQD